MICAFSIATGISCTRMLYWTTCIGVFLFRRLRFSYEVWGGEMGDGAGRLGRELGVWIGGWLGVCAGCSGSTALAGRYEGRMERRKERGGDTACKKQGVKQARASTNVIGHQQQRLYPRSTLTALGLLSQCVTQAPQKAMQLYLASVSKTLLALLLQHSHSEPNASISRKLPCMCVFMMCCLFEQNMTRRHKLCMQLQRLEPGLHMHAYFLRSYIWDEQFHST